MRSRRPLMIVTLLAVLVGGCASRGSDRGRERERGSGHGREDDAFTIHTADDWNDAAGRLVNHAVANVLP
jgi:hypothetical protein